MSEMESRRAQLYRQMSHSETDSDEDHPYSSHQMVKHHSGSGRGDVQEGEEVDVKFTAENLIERPGMLF